MGRDKRACPINPGRAERKACTKSVWAVYCQWVWGKQRSSSPDWPIWSNPVPCMWTQGCGSFNLSVNLCVSLCIWPINWFNCWFQWSAGFPGWGHGEHKRTEGGLRGPEPVQGMGSRSRQDTGQEMYTAMLVLDWKGQSPFREGIETVG